MNVQTAVCRLTDC